MNRIRGEYNATYVFCQQHAMMAGISNLEMLPIPHVHPIQASKNCEHSILLYSNPK